MALSSDRHVHYEAAHRWFAGVAPGGAVFCRLTQLGYLRLLTNPRVMGDDAVNQREAWRIYDRLREDARVGYVAEPPAETENRQLSRRFLRSFLRALCAFA